MARTKTARLHENTEQFEDAIKQLKKRFDCHGLIAVAVWRNADQKSRSVASCTSGCVNCSLDALATMLLDLDRKDLLYILNQLGGAGMVNKHAEKPTTIQ